MASTYDHEAPEAYRREHETDEPTEETPLIASDHADANGDVEQPARRPSHSPASTSLLRSIQGDSGKKSRLKRWPSIIALIVLCVAIIIILVAGFVAPSVVSEYAKQAVVFEPENLSIVDFTATGVVARVQGSFHMDASKVSSKPTRDLGRFGTWIAREIETKATTVEVTLPEYGNLAMGSAIVPSIQVNIRNGHLTPIDFLTQLEPGSKEAIRRIADDWMSGRLGQLSVHGVADVTVKSGLITLPKQSITQSLVFESHDIPTMPDFDILKLNVHEEEVSTGSKVLAADVAIQLANSYPVDVQVPPLGFQLLVPGCTPTDTYVMLADASTKPMHVEPKHDIVVNATGIIRRFSKEAVTACPGSIQSPLDVFLGNYIHGENSTVFVRGSEASSHMTPRWIVDLMSDITVPVPFPGRSFGHLIKEYKMEHVHFDLPDLFADPDTPESNPRVSAQIKALISLPDEFDIKVGVDRVRADADVYYKKKNMGELDLHKWLPAEAKPVDKSDKHSDLLVLSRVDQAPLVITDSDLFSEVVSELLTSSSGVNLTVKAEVDVEMETVLGKLVVRRIPAEGDVPVNPIGRSDFSHLSPQVGDLKIAATSPNSLTLTAMVNVTNPTNYTATIPYFDIKMSVNNTFIGHGTVRDLNVVSGENINMPVTAYWDPVREGGQGGRAVASELLSQYISGYNTSLTISVHANSIPASPDIGKALASLNVTLPMPNLAGPPDPDHPSDPDDPETPREKPHFIRNTIFHLISSTAVFTLASPFHDTTMYITHMNATAYYKHHPAGRILYEGSLKVPPGLSTTPRLPVDWSLDDLGFEAIKNALGGRLQLDAKADCGVLIGEYAENLWYEGHGIGAAVRL